MSWVAVGVGVVGAAATAYSASQTPDAAPPAQADPGRDLTKYIAGLKKGLPDLQSLESEYRPQFGKLNIADQQQYLDALLGFSGQATAGARQQLELERQADIQSMQGRSGGVMQLLGMLDPNGRDMVENQAQMANQRYAAAQSLNAQERRIADQTAREAFAARGRLNDNAGVAAEILNREEVLSAKRNEAARMGLQSLQMSQGYSSPALGLLGSVPASVAAGRDYLAMSQSMIGQNTPQLINPDAGINLGQQNAANLNAYMQAQTAAQSNRASMYGQAGSSLLDLAGTIYKSR